MNEMIAMMTAMLVGILVTQCGLPANPDYIEQATLHCQAHGGVHRYWAEPMDYTNQVDCKDGSVIEFRVTTERNKP